VLYSEFCTTAGVGDENVVLYSLFITSVE